MRRPSRQGTLSLCLRFAQDIDIIANTLTGYFYNVLQVPVLILPFTSVAQNINHEGVGIELYRAPLKPLKVHSNTFSVTDLGNQLHEQSLENIQVRNGHFTRDDFLRIVDIYNEYKKSKATAQP